MKAVIKKVGCEAMPIEIDNTLKALQDAVGGHIEAVTFSRDMIIICNEEGAINGMPFNCMICGTQFFGDILFVGVDGDEFGDIPIPSEDVCRMFFGR